MYTYTYIVLCIHLVACRHQDITWTNVDLSKFCVTHLRPILQEVLKMSISIMGLKKKHLWNDFHIPQGTPVWRMSFHFFIKVSIIRWFLSWDLSLVAPNPVPCYLVTSLQLIWKSGISKFTGNLSSSELQWRFGTTILTTAITTNSHTPRLSFSRRHHQPTKVWLTFLTPVTWGQWRLTAPLQHPQ